MNASSNFWIYIFVGDSFRLNLGKITGINRIRIPRTMVKLFRYDSNLLTTILIFFNLIFQRRMKSIEYSDNGTEVNENTNDRMETDLTQIRTDRKPSDRSTDIQVDGNLQISLERSRGHQL